MIFNNRRFNFTSLLLASVAVFLFIGTASGQTNEFTYQGKLSDSRMSSTTYDFKFSLCDSLAADCAAMPLATQEITGVPVSGGVFTVKLNFSATLFDGSNRWRLPF